MAVCTLTDIVSMFVCAQNGAPFTELLTIAVFFLSLILFGVYPLREKLPVSLFVSTLVSAVFLAMGVINPFVTLAGVLLTGVSVVFLYMNNTSG